MANKSSRKRQKKETEGEVATRVSEMREGISQMESFMKEAAALAAAEVQRIDEIRGNLEGTLACLEAELREKEELLNQKDSAYRESQEGLGARISDLEGEIRRRGELLESREAEIADLQSRINALTVSSEGDGQRRERNPAVVEEVERGLEDRSYLDDPSEEEPEDFEPSAREEAKVKLIGQSMRDVVVKPGGVARRGPVPDARKSRFLSLLAPIKKGG